MAATESDKRKAKRLSFFVEKALCCGRFSVTILKGEKMGRILALDVGDARIGIAVSDPMKIVANPLSTLFRKKTDEDFEEIARIAKEQDAELIVCGLPKSMNNEENAQTVKTREFVEKLKGYVSVQVKFFDERLTTVSAERALIEGGVRRENRKNVIDKVAATMILQNYLAYLN